MTAESTLLYCYAIARPPDAEAFPPVEPADLAGVGGSGVDLVRCEDLVAVVSPVPAEQFNENALYQGLEDITWLEEVARAHNAVVEALARLSAVVPLRLATVYLDEHRVRAVVRERQDEFCAALDHVAGHLEWGLKVHTEPAPGPARQRNSEDDSGRSYLRRRLAERRTGESVRQRALTIATELDETASAHARDLRYHRPQSAALSNSRGENVFNASYLVPINGADEFVELAQEFARNAGKAQVEVTGQWAPYSFALDPAARSGQAQVEAVHE